MSKLEMLNVDLDSTGTCGIFSFKSEEGNIHLVFTENGKYKDKSTLEGEEIELDPYIVAEDIENNYKELIEKD